MKDESKKGCALCNRVLSFSEFSADMSEELCNDCYKNEQNHFQIKKQPSKKNLPAPLYFQWGLLILGGIIMCLMGLSKNISAAIGWGCFILAELEICYLKRKI